MYCIIGFTIYADILLFAMLKPSTVKIILKS